MSSEYGYEFYMQECDNKGKLLANTTRKSLEKDFNVGTKGCLRYSKIDGIEAVGSVKNSFAESYADADRLRVYVPKDVKHKETTVTLTLYFLGEDRFKVLHTFNEYVKNGFHRYWDTARGKWFAFYLKDELKPAEQMWYGSEPYLKMDYKLVNIFGKTFDVE